APLAKFIFTTLLYVSPVQMIPSCDQTGTPDIEFDGFLHFTSSITSGSACLMRVRIRASIFPRQSSSCLIGASIKSESDFFSFPCFEPVFVVFIVVSLYSQLLKLSAHMRSPGNWLACFTQAATCASSSWS